MSAGVFRSRMCRLVKELQLFFVFFCIVPVKSYGLEAEILQTVNFTQDKVFLSSMTTYYAAAIEYFGNSL